MVKNFFVSIFIFCVFAMNLNAQSIDDILKASYQNYEGTARFSAMGGAFGALGGDVSSLSINPAGIAVFRKHHLSFTSSQNHVYNNSDFAGTKTGDSRTRFGISSLGVAFVMEQDEQTRFNIGITYTKRENFNRRTAAVNDYATESIIDYFANKANGDKDFFLPEDLNASDAFDYFNPLDWDLPMAYGTYLIDWDGNDYLGCLAEGDIVKQRINTLLKGSSGEINLIIGSSHKDKFFTGISLGVSTLNYKRIVTYSEHAHENNMSDFNSLIYNTNLKIGGFGLNYKLGIIYKPARSVRFGLSFQSPDYYFASSKAMYDEYEDEEEVSAPMDNLYSASLDVKYNTADGIETYSDGPGEEYYLFFERMKTPSKTTASFAYIFGKLGLISMDCEYVNYAKTVLKGNEPKSIFNADIKEYFKRTVNLRFGAETWIRNIALRAGYVYNQSPDKSYDLSRRTYSAGIGFKYNHLN
ncbi:MAG: hypothetical protein LBT50_07850, partial [Prevotellaceae bacterium]|nr:hypothetical protein [Prevotellaceae bacterium]